MIFEHQSRLLFLHIHFLVKVVSSVMKSSHGAYGGRSVSLSVSVIVMVA